MLSTRFGYGRPAFVAARLAAAFCLGVKGLDLIPLGLGLSQTFLRTVIGCDGYQHHKRHGSHAALQHQKH